MSILNKARNVEFSNLNAYTATNINISHASQAQSLPKDPIDILHHARAIEATHTSTLASHAGKCHPKTRIKVIADIVEWVTGAREGDSLKPMLWFRGPAGAGKSSIMRSVVEQCEEAEHLIASYFFSTSSRASGLNHERPFMATISHQLSIDPILRKSIFEAIRERPTIFQESLDLQMKKLVVDPLKSYSRKILIAVDGLDECSEKSERKHLLGLLYTLARTLPTISIVIASRPEQDIREVFDKQDYKDVTYVLRLEDYDGMEDTRIHVCDEFHNIRETHPMKRFLPGGWPVETDVNLLLDKSSGIFIVSSTAMKHIANPRRDPVKSLEEVLALWSRTSSTSRAGQENPLAELDLLYHLILHPPETDLSLVKRILHSVIGTLAVISHPYHSSSFLEEFLRLPPGTVGITLCDLHSIILVPEDDGVIRFHHKSLEDYLLSPARSLDMFQEPYETHLDLALHCIHHIQTWTSDPYTWGGTPSLYHGAQYWDRHFTKFLSNKPKAVALPKTILDFDPRLVLRGRFIRDMGSWNLTLSRPKVETIHDKLCGSRSCLQLCKTIRWIERCDGKIASFTKSFGTIVQTKRIEGLARFDIETGLYDPNAQFTDPDDLSNPASFPGLGAWPTHASITAPPGRVESVSKWSRMVARLKRWFRERPARGSS